ncbi:hypothetical protein [Dactylosporangium cerinum]
MLDADGVARDLSGLTADIDGVFLAGGGIRRVREALEAGTLPVLADPRPGSVRPSPGPARWSASASTTAPTPLSPAPSRPPSRSCS